LPPPTGAVCELSFGAHDLAGLRTAVARWAASHDLEPARAEELVLAVNELACNSVRFGGGHGALRMWREGEVLLCEVSDRGRIADPRAGRLRPQIQTRAGRGMWIVNQACDVVQVQSSCEGTAVRVHKQLRS
jgi:anti-sigma regulatory factor (Ser/Thr protein kinase)